MENSSESHVGGELQMQIGGVKFSCIYAMKDSIGVFGRNAETNERTTSCFIFHGWIMYIWVIDITCFLMLAHITSVNYTAT